MNYSGEMCNTTCEPPRVSEPSVTEMTAKCHDIIEECQAITDNMLHLVGGEILPGPQEPRKPGCLTEAAMMNCDSARMLSDMLRKLSGLLGG